MGLDAERLKEIFAPLGAVTVKRMFGGAGIYFEGLCFAIESQGEVFLKVDDKNRSEFQAAGSRPFMYVMRGVPRETSYWLLVESAYDDPNELRRWANLGRGAARRAAESKAPKKAAVKTKAKKAARR